MLLEAASDVAAKRGEPEGALQYRSIIQAVRMINKNKQQIQDEEDLGFTISPAWRLLDDAARHLLKQADVVLRGEGPKG